ncbi:HAD-IA family hydrolase [Streptomyces sp. TRM49041]|uniref:HAD-IA family hydrolase n=1 Tax=Streptomyces sp. TRM49041 TaxID=2603216 RepID=UPI0016568814|nr:HAD-IA family hydrolase [Streptomyces sp. TRM49041]
MDTVLFDLDGTLVDTLDDIVRSVNTALRDHGLPALSRTEVRDRVGEGGTALIEASVRKSGRAVGPALVARAQESYLTGYAAAPAEESRPYPGAEVLLSRLRAAGIRTALCTNKAGGVTAELLRALGLDGWFDAVVTGDGPAGRKPSPEPLRHALKLAGGSAGLMVGDSRHDLAAAHAAAMPAAWVGFGYGRPDADRAPDLELPRLDALESAARAAHIRLHGTTASASAP